MHSLNLLKDLYSHMDWADSKIWETVLSLPVAQEDEKLKMVLHHYHITQYAFYHIWRSLPLELPEVSKFKNLQELATWASKCPDLLKTFLAGLREDDLAKEIIIPWTDRIEKLLGKNPSGTNLGETLLQVAVHSSHHRGQANSRIRELQGEPPLIDFIAWVWLRKPVAVWPV